LADRKLVVAWSQLEGRAFRIWCRTYDRGEWQPARQLSASDEDAHRPLVTATDANAAWVFWDQYDGNRYSVVGRPAIPEIGPLENVSPRDSHCLQPAALHTGQGMCVAWLRKADVIGGPGVISQWHTLEMAIRRNGAWSLVTDSRGKATAAELTHGLMAKIAPKPVATGGYLGRRTQAMLLESDDAVWMLWERKADHRGSTPNVTGELIGRPMRGGRWGSAVILHRGRLDYHLAHPPVARQGAFSVVCSALPRQNRRQYFHVVGDLRDTIAYRQESWTGWQAVDLPIERELTPRRSIRVGGERYYLYWGDLHCHSGLTADAEGAPDELTHYARDRAALDVVTFTENDFIYDVPLTMYEYELGNLFANAYSQSERFLSLPGYEWTSRIPGVAQARISDPGNWTPPYQNRSFPNHRSVIYPPSAGPLVHYPEVGNQISTLYEAVESAGGITLTQHPVFEIVGHDVEVGMEVTSGWSSYLSQRPKSFHEPLDRGIRLAFVANGDSHRRAPGLSGGLTGIYAKSLTSADVLQALRQRRCYATNGSRIFVDARASDAMMGQTVSAPDGRVTLSIHAIGTRPLVEASLFRNGESIASFDAANERELSVSHIDEDVPVGTHWYHWRVAQERRAPDLPGNLMAACGHLAWSSPMWVRVE
jgi:hypothetical protein